MWHVEDIEKCFEFCDPHGGLAKLDAYTKTCFCKNKVSINIAFMVQAEADE
jgi:hypothetical protein